MQLDLLLWNCRIADVFRLRTFRGWLGVRDGRFVYVEEGDPPAGLAARERRDLAGAIVTPGLIDSHMHIESSLLTPRRFAEAVLPLGTTTVLADPHEIANVAGEAGLEWFLAAAAGLSLEVFVALPSCVPATSSELEWTAAVLDAGMVERFAGRPAVLALGEVMDYRRLLTEAAGDGLSAMIEAARRRGLLVEGHVPTLRSLELSEYFARGIGSDHTLTSPDKLREQLSKGAAVMLQLKSLTTDVVAAVNELSDRSHVLLVTDDIEPSMLRDGHLSLILTAAVEAGLPLLEALASASIRPARYLGLDRGSIRRGGIAPGWQADFLILDELNAFPPREVHVSGRLCARDGHMTEPDAAAPAGEASRSAAAAVPSATIEIARACLPGLFRPEDFRITACGVRRGVACVIRVADERTSLTRLERRELSVRDGFAYLEDADLCLAAVFARDGSSYSVAVLAGLGLAAGAAATSFAHDSHNLLAVGRDPADLAAAANAVRDMAGGVAVARDGRMLARLELPVFGLLSDQPWHEVADDLEKIERVLAGLGMGRRRPFLMISLLSLSVSPYAKLSNRGIVDTEARRIVAPWEDLA